VVVSSLATNLGRAGHPYGVVMETQAPERGHRYTRGRCTRVAAVTLLLLLAAGAVGLYVRSTPVLSLRIPTGWHVVTGPSMPGLGAHAGELALAGPGEARFNIYWSPQGISQGCADTCPSPIRALDTTVDGRPTTLLAWPGLGTGHGTFVTGSLEHDVAGRPLHFDILCDTAAASGESVCADIVNSISWSAPLFAGLRPNAAVVAIS
jgi:hypothetical protein